MPQAIWKGTISFGLVTIPVKLYSATEEKDISFRQVHEEDGGRIRYRRVCEIDGEEVPYSDIGKGYEMPDGRMVILTSDDFAQLPLPTAKAIEVLEFVPIEQVDPLYFAKAYYLGAESGPGGKPYVLLRDALTKSKQCRAGEGRDPHPRGAGPAAREGRRAGAADHAVAGRGARLELRSARRLRRDPQAGGRDGGVLHLDPQVGVRPRALPLRLPRGPGAARRGQGRGRPDPRGRGGRGRDRRRRRPGRGAARERRRRQEATCRREVDSETKAAKKATAKKTAKKAAKKAPAKKSTAKKTTKKTASKKTASKRAAKKSA